MKTCTGCGRQLPLNSYSKMRSGKNSRCRDCVNARNRKWRKTANGKVRVRASALATRDHNLFLIRKSKNKPCTDCGIKYPYYVMDFDHVRGRKLLNLGAARCKPTRMVEAEIAKCDVVCANCHRKREFRRKTPS